MSGQSVCLHCGRSAPDVRAEATRVYVKADARRHLQQVQRETGTARVRRQVEGLLLRHYMPHWFLIASYAVFALLVIAYRIGADGASWWLALIPLILGLLAAVARRALAKDRASMGGTEW